MTERAKTSGAKPNNPISVPSPWKERADLHEPSSSLHTCHGVCMQIHPHTPKIINHVFKMWGEIEGNTWCWPVPPHSSKMCDAQVYMCAHECIHHSRSHTRSIFWKLTKNFAWKGQWPEMVSHIQGLDRRVTCRSFDYSQNVRNFSKED